MFRIDSIEVINNFIVIGVKLFENISGDASNIGTRPMSFTVTDIVIVWVGTEERFRFWTSFKSPLVFGSKGTFPDFPETDVTITILITFSNKHIVVINSDLVTKINLTITVGISSGHEFFSNSDKIRAVPSTFTLWWFNWTFTIRITVISWTVFISPSIFTSDYTFVDFTNIKGTI